MAKELVELKTPSGARIQVYPTLDSTASPAKVEHSFKTDRQAVINQSTIPVQEGITLVAQRPGQGVNFGAVLHEHTDFLNNSIFNPASITQARPAVLSMPWFVQPMLRSAITDASSPWSLLALLPRRDQTASPFLRWTLRFEKDLTGIPL